LSVDAPRLETPRLILRAAKRSDGEPDLRMMTDSEVARYTYSISG
jgi:hypothetical protein